MKIELDTIKKTILLNDKVNIGELYDMFAELGLDVDEWTLLSHPQITISSPWYQPSPSVKTLEWVHPDFIRGSSNPYTINGGILTTSENGIISGNGNISTGNTSGNTTNFNTENCTPTK